MHVALLFEVRNCHLLLINFIYLLRELFEFWGESEELAIFFGGTGECGTVFT